MKLFRPPILPCQGSGGNIHARSRAFREQEGESTIKMASDLLISFFDDLPCKLLVNHATTNMVTQFQNDSDGDPMIAFGVGHHDRVMLPG